MDESHSAALEESGRIQELLDEVRELSPPLAWERVEELMQRLLALQREGLSRLLSHARASGADARLDARIAEDELVSSLLLLHGLHPVPARDRVLRALEELRPRLLARGGRAELVAVEDGVARLRFAGPVDGLQEQLRRALEDAAPDLARVEIEASTGPLVSLGLPRSAP